MHTRYQGRIEPPKAARGHATSNSANIDSIVLNVTKDRHPCAHFCVACKTAHTVEVLTFTQALKSKHFYGMGGPTVTQFKEQRI